jgi:hypothetical protein
MFCKDIGVKPVHKRTGFLSKDISIIIMRMMRRTIQFYLENSKYRDLRQD